MKNLDDDLQFGLKVASCIGSSVKISILDILSKDIGKNLHDILQQISQKGFIANVDGTTFHWLHDKVQQAAYFELMQEQERRMNHLQFGLALCAHSLSSEVSSNGAEHDDLFFLTINQINKGGCDALVDPDQTVMASTLNLKAGKRSIEIMDLSSALKLFEHGISYLDSDQRWKQNYSLSLDLHNAAIETACFLRHQSAVTRLSEQVLTNATNTDDKLNCLFFAVKSLRLSFKFSEAKSGAYMVLEQLGEILPRPSKDVGLATNIQEVKLILQNLSDDSIMNLPETNQKKRDFVSMNLYHDLNFLFGVTDTELLMDPSLRMVKITLQNRLCPLSTFSFLHFGTTLVNFEDYGLAYRLGTLSMRLLDKANAQRYTSVVIALVANYLSWLAEPFQSIGETHLLGPTWIQVWTEI